MKKYIITAKLRKNDDGPLGYVTDIELNEDDDSYFKEKKICHYTPTITWLRNSACILEEIQAKQIFSELKKLPDLYFDLVEVSDDKD